MTTWARTTAAFSRSHSPVLTDGLLQRFADGRRRIRVALLRVWRRRLPPVHVALIRTPKDGAYVIRNSLRTLRWSYRSGDIRLLGKRVLGVRRFTLVRTSAHWKLLRGTSGILEYGKAPVRL